jgi:dihydrofolate reductase
VRELKATAGKDVVVTGSITLTHALIEAALVDEYRLFVYPAVQGRGRPLFPRGTAGPALRLIGKPMSFGQGIVLLRYQPADR